MLRSATVLLIACCTTSMAWCAEVIVGLGDYVVVRASIEGCPDFPGVVAHAKIDSESSIIRLFQLGPTSVYGRSAPQIAEALSTQVAEARADGTRPSSLRVEILRSEQEFRLLQDEIADSYQYLLRNRCLRSPPPQTPPMEPDTRLAVAFS